MRVPQFRDRITIPTEACPAPSGNRQMQRKRCPVTWRCLHRHAAAKCAQGTLDETQSQSRAARRRGSLTLSAIERFEDMRQIFRRDSRPAVSNSDLHFLALPVLRVTRAYT